MKSKNMILVMLGFIVVVALILANRREGAPEEASRLTTQTQTQASQPTAAPAEATSAAPASDESAKTAGSTPSLPGAESTASAAQVETHKVPHFHLTLAEAGPLPKILPASQFSIPIVAKAYRAAARIPEVLAQQPCYCWCEKMGHGSLVDCFATTHGAG